MIISTRHPTHRINRATKDNTRSFREGSAIYIANHFHYNLLVCGIIRGMYKLIILIEPPLDPSTFDESWPQFLHQAERMPGLQREASVRVTRQLFGYHQVHMIHELFFETQADLQAAMASPQGQASGQILQRITDGRMTLLFAEHREDVIENLRKYQAPDDDTDPR